MRKLRFLTTNVMLIAAANTDSPWITVPATIGGALGILLWLLAKYLEWRGVIQICPHCKGVGAVDVPRHTATFREIRGELKYYWADELDLE